MSLKRAALQPAFDGGLIAAGTPLPSGQSVELFEVLVDQIGDEAWLRFRFIAPGIVRDEQGLGFEDAQADFEYLCKEIAVPYLDEFNLSADVIVLTLLDRPVAFGTTDAAATQLIEAFRLQGRQCEWEGLW